MRKGNDIGERAATGAQARFDHLPMAQATGGRRGKARDASDTGGSPRRRCEVRRRTVRVGHIPGGSPDASAGALDAASEAISLHHGLQALPADRREPGKKAFPSVATQPSMVVGNYLHHDG